MNRTKVTVACQACQKKKVKCTGSAPCTTCSRSGHKCVFSNNAKKRGPRNGNVEVIRTSAHRIENVLQNYPNLRGHIEQMLGGGKSNNNKRRQSIRLQDLIDDDKINDGLSSLSSYPYLVPTKSKDDVTIKPQRRQDQLDRQEDHQSPIFCRPMPIYPYMQQRNHVTKDDLSPSNRSDDINNRYAQTQTGPLTSHSNISEIVSLTTNPLLQQPIAKNMETSSSIKDLTLPPPYVPKRKAMSMSIYNSSLGTQLLLPSPDLGMDFLQKKSLICSHNNNNNNENSLEHVENLNEFFMKNEKKSSVTSMKISLPSLPSPLSSSPSPRSTSTNYPPTPTSSTSPLMSPMSPQAYTAKRSSIHLLSKPAPWCAYDHSFQEQNDFMQIDGSY
ncbi:hypothetical protein C1645_787688 [Glomus cerebriforme]|uniref:Zn(2)-C6 fungal-type domain-containing protein n=1 Tax=Glomus cerebriforme TaxID=658196 RepID=A0A397S8U3_9GLOM|nr:hypothetical protein C1645_787688 [Glomus cerebriforme]